MKIVEVINKLLDIYIFLSFAVSKPVISTIILKELICREIKHATISDINIYYFSDMEQFTFYFCNYYLYILQKTTNKYIYFIRKIEKSYFKTHKLVFKPLLRT